MQKTCTDGYLRPENMHRWIFTARKYAPVDIYGQKICTGGYLGYENVLMDI